MTGRPRTCSLYDRRRRTRCEFGLLAPAGSTWGVKRLAFEQLREQRLVGGYHSACFSTPELLARAGGARFAFAGLKKVGLWARTRRLSTGREEPCYEL